MAKQTATVVEAEQLRIEKRIKNSICSFQSALNKYDFPDPLCVLLVVADNFSICAVVIGV